MGSASASASKCSAVVFRVFFLLGVDADGRNMPAECSLLSARTPKSVDSSNGWGLIEIMLTNHGLSWIIMVMYLKLSISAEVKSSPAGWRLPMFLWYGGRIFRDLWWSLMICCSCFRMILGWSGFPKRETSQEDHRSGGHTFWKTLKNPYHILSHVTAYQTIFAARITACRWQLAAPWLTAQRLSALHHVFQNWEGWRGQGRGRSSSLLGVSWWIQRPGLTEIGLKKWFSKLLTILDGIYLEFHGYSRNKEGNYFLNFKPCCMGYWSFRQNRVVKQSSFGLEANKNKLPWHLGTRSWWTDKLVYV